MSTFLNLVNFFSQIFQLFFYIFKIRVRYNKFILFSKFIDKHSIPGTQNKLPKS